MDERQHNELVASIERTGNGLALMILAAIIVGSCVVEHVGDKIATEIHDSGRVVGHEIEHKNCR